MEEKEYIGKRVNLEKNNIKKMKILTALFENELDGLNEKKKFDYVLNKVISDYYGSDKVKELLVL